MVEKLKYLYHATSEENAMAILDDGFDTNITYFCGSPEHAAEFLYMVHGEGLYHVIEVDVSKLDGNNLEESFDHNPKFYTPGLKAYVHFGEVPWEALADRYFITGIKKQ